MLDRLKKTVLENPLTGRIYLSLRYGLQTHCIYSYLKVNGWLTVPEAIGLFRVSRNEISCTNPVIVEIGSWQGKSSIVLAKGISHKPAGKVYCIDPFDASGDAPSEQIYQNYKISTSITLMEQFQENIKRSHLVDQVVCMKGFSTDFSRKWDKPIDFLFIDGNHDFEAVKKDFEEWSPHIKQGGIIGFHDVWFDASGNPAGPYPGTARVIKQCILISENWFDFRQIESLFLAKKKS